MTNPDDPSSSGPASPDGDDALHERRIPAFGGIIVDPRGFGRAPYSASPAEREAFARILTRQQRDPGYRARLLTFKEKGSIDWAEYTESERLQMLRGTSAAMVEEGGPDIDPQTKFVVLSNRQFSRNVYRMMQDDEVVLRVPDALSDNMFARVLETKAVEAILLQKIAQDPASFGQNLSQLRGVLAAEYAKAKPDQKLGAKLAARLHNEIHIFGM
jgi:hypothetical protein